MGDNVLDTIILQYKKLFGSIHFHKGDSAYFNDFILSQGLSHSNSQARHWSNSPAFLPEVFVNRFGEFQLTIWA